MGGRSDSGLRVVVDDGDRPALQIARDLALLNSDCSATMRVYGWRPAGLSLGRFQDAAKFTGIDLPHEVVRRPTGGGAIWHADELTWSLVAADDPRIDSEAWYLRLHDALIRALDTVGVRAHRDTTGPLHPGPRDPDTLWCFARPCRGDLLGPCGRKLCGSAMRRIRSPSPRMLIHGSIVLRNPTAGPPCAAVEDQTDPSRVRVPLRDAMAHSIADALDRPMFHADLTAEEERAAAELVGGILVAAHAR